MSNYQSDIDAVGKLRAEQGSAWGAINPESAARMKAQNRFKTGIDIAKQNYNYSYKYFFHTGI